MQEVESLPGGPQRRLSITKLQRQSAAGAELIALCQGVTEDGTLTDFEILKLEGWLVENEQADLPARDYLRSLLRSCTSDGLITDEERVALYRAIEAVLPPDIRATVRRTRIAGDQKERVAQREARALAREAAVQQAKAQRDAERETRLRAKPLESLDFVVAGVNYEGRAAVVEKFCVPGNSVYLLRDRANRFSRNAVEVRIANGMQIGYVPEVLARLAAPLLDAGNPHIARIKKIFMGRQALIPVVIASVFRADCGVSGVVFEKSVPP